MTRQIVLIGFSLTINLRTPPKTLSIFRLELDTSLCYKGYNFRVMLVLKDGKLCILDQVALI